MGAGENRFHTTAPRGEPRIAPVTDPDAAVAQLLEKTRIAGGEPLNLFRTLAHHPRLLERFNALGGAFMRKPLLSLETRELAILRVGWRTGSAYEFRQHEAIARELGLRAELIAWATADLEDVPAAEASVLRAVDELLDTDDVADETWAALADRWPAAELIELVALVGFYRLVAVVTNSLRIVVDVGGGGDGDAE
jgi:4-carboxymuconolactone decarboxylase